MLFWRIRLVLAYSQGTLLLLSLYESCFLNPGFSCRSHIPLMFLGMEHIILSNFDLADEALNAADKIYDSINGTLENSLQFVFGRFKDQTSGDSPLPKTLEEARRLVSSPTRGASTSSRNGDGRWESLLLGDGRSVA